MPNERRVLRSIESPEGVPESLLDADANNAMLKCPVCDDTYSHVRGAHSLLGSDESGGGYKGAEVTGKTPYRRDALAVRVAGESCGHEWDVVFQQHKGQTFLRIDILQAGPV
jgi:hypothetical protein